MTELLLATKKYVEVSKKAKKLLSEADWCCHSHQIAAQVKFQALNNTKNAFYASYKDGEIDEPTFVGLIEAGTEVMQEFCDALAKTSIMMDKKINVFGSMGDA